MLSLSLSKLWKTTLLLLLTINKLNNIITRAIVKKANIDILYTIYALILENIFDELGLTFIRINSINI